MRYLTISILLSIIFITFTALSINNEVRAGASLELKWIKTIREPYGLGKSISFSPDGQTVAYTCGDGSVRFWSLKESKVVFALDKVSTRIGSIVYCPDGKILATGGGDSINRLWSLKTGEMIREFKHEYGFHKGETIGNIAISPDGKILASPGTKSNKAPIELWSIETGKLLKTVGGREGADAISLTFSPDGKILAACVNNEIRLWSVQTGEKLEAEFSELDNISSFAYSLDGKMIVAGGGNEQKGIIKFWNTENYQEIRLLNGHDSRVMCLTISPNGKYLLTGSKDEMIKIWSTDSGELILTHEPHKSYVCTVAFSPDNKTIATASVAGIMSLWSIEL